MTRNEGHSTMAKAELPNEAETAEEGTKKGKERNGEASHHACGVLISIETRLEAHFICTNRWAICHWPTPTRRGNMHQDGTW